MTVLDLENEVRRLNEQDAPVRKIHATSRYGCLLSLKGAAVTRGRSNSPNSYRKILVPLKTPWDFRRRGDVIEIAALGDDPHSPRIKLTDTG